jgi:hypothetical protein
MVYFGRESEISVKTLSISWDFSPPQHPDRLWGLPSLLLDGKTSNVSLTTHLCLLRTFFPLARMARGRETALPSLIRGYRKDKELSRSVLQEIGSLSTETFQAVLRNFDSAVHLTGSRTRQTRFTLRECTSRAYSHFKCKNNSEVCKYYFSFTTKWNGLTNKRLPCLLNPHPRSLPDRLDKRESIRNNPVMISMKLLPAHCS